MAYDQGARLPGESASKLGHLSVVNSKWVKSLLADFEQAEIKEGELHTVWHPFEDTTTPPLRNIWATDGSYVRVTSSGKPPKEMAFVKTALLTIDRTRLDKIDKDHPHPLLIQDVLRDSAIFHATVFPMKNVRTSLGSNYDAVRHIIHDSLKIDEEGMFFETLKWIAYQKWRADSRQTSPSFECPHCHFKVEGLPFDSDEGTCSDCGNGILLSDMIGFHLDMDEDGAPDSVASAYMLVMEHLMIFTAIRLLWNHTDKSLVSDTLFIKDGPLTLRSQYSKLVPNIRSFLEFAKKQGRPIHVIGQEKSGAFFDHLASFVMQVSPKTKEEPLHFATLSHEYVRKEVYRSPDLANSYGKRTNWGEKVYVKIEPGTALVLNVPTGEYQDDVSFPGKEDLIGISKILATLPKIISHKFEGALFPIELANGIASMSSYPSAKILQRFIDDRRV
ncbi:hypothetical protein [Dawidia soli]|uniref:NurA domain-containing protein n=1 Tax=Dawidia soli TaxID=2782352 RepID=A0AAP2DCF5_9BACT|nr:hypothetical protein [Dawidia soli]MBT1689218.1 hypothetical protein [Dawidia soli]